jgi:putative transposase
MSEFRQTTPDDTYFITLTITGWIDLFSKKSYKDIVVESLKYCQKSEQLEIFCYVIMPSHLHMICRRLDNDLNELLGRFKSYTSKMLLREIESSGNESRKEWLLQQFHAFAKSNKQYSDYHVWQYSNYATPLFTNEVLTQKQEYIHQNPVRAGIVVDPCAYLYSSACPESPLRVIEM